MDKSESEQASGTSESNNSSICEELKEKDDMEQNIEHLRKYISRKLGFGKDSAEDKEQPDRVLDEVSLEGVVKYIKDGKCKNIIVMAGAGISTSAGIPDFRSPVSGLYFNLQKYNLPHPQAIFELDYFHQNPKPFFELARELYPGSFEPTVSHYLVRLLHDKGLLLRHYTQNIDTLERIAGIPEEKLVEAHGSFNKGHCLKCTKEFSQEWMKDKIFAGEIPHCDKCETGVVKPDIVFFGENLDKRFFKCIKADFPKCDLLIVMGSSLVVQPFASLIDRVPETCPRLLINRDKAGEVDSVMKMIGMGNTGFDFDAKIRDVLLLEDCDEGCLRFAKLLGWQEELQELKKKETDLLKEKATPKDEDHSKNATTSEDT